LGDILKVDSFVLGYDLTSLNLSGETEVKGNMKDLPDVILIKKIFPEHNRIWKLKQLDKEEIDMNNFHKNSNQREKEYNEFLKDLENDPEMRSKINLYRDEKAIQSWKKKNEMKDENEPEEVDKKSKKTKIKIKAKTKKASTEIIYSKIKEMEMVMKRRKKKSSSLTLQEKLQLIITI